MSAVRGLCANDLGNQLYTVIGDTLYYVARDGTRTELGQLRTRRGYVDMRVGVSQLAVVDGRNLYTYDLTSGAFVRVVNEGWLGSARVGYAGGYFLFSNGRVFYISAIEDAGSLDPLDFTTAPASPDGILCVIDSHGDALIFGQVTTEPWNNTGAADFPWEQNKGGIMDTGCLGAFTVRALDNSLFWLGGDKSGAGMVFRTNGYQAQRISDVGVEQAIQRAIAAGEDMTRAIAYAYTHNGHPFYCLNVPGLDTTFSYDVSSGNWHERAEFELGSYAPHRGKFHAYCYGKHIIGADDGILYSYALGVNNNAGDILVRDRISPHYSEPTMAKVTYGTFELNCSVGNGLAADGTEAKVMMRSSDNGGKSWDDWRTETLGAIGESVADGARARWTRNGSAFDRVWHVRCVDDTPFRITGAVVKGRM